MNREDFNVDSKMQDRMLATTGEMITIWYAGTKANERVPFRARVMKASQKHGMHIEHIDLEEDDPRKEDWLNVESKNWLIGDWHTYSSKDEAQHERAGQKADAIAARLRQGAVRSKESAQAVARPPARTRIAAHQDAHAPTRTPHPHGCIQPADAAHQRQRTLLTALVLPRCDPPLLSTTTTLACAVGARDEAARACERECD